VLVILVVVLLLAAILVLYGRGRHAAAPDPAVEMAAG
jgi:hypothetical protein